MRGLTKKARWCLHWLWIILHPRCQITVQSCILWMSMKNSFNLVIKIGMRTRIYWNAHVSRFLKFSFLLTGFERKTPTRSKLSKHKTQRRWTRVEKATFVAIIKRVVASWKNVGKESFSGAINKRWKKSFSTSRWFKFEGSSQKFFNIFRSSFVIEKA